MKRILFVIFVIGVLTSCVSDIQNTMTKTSSESIDELYRHFSRAYETFDVDLVSSLYTENAHYLPSNPNKPILESREAIKQSFASYFEMVKSSGRDMKISFRILERKITDSLAYDTGYYFIQSKLKDSLDFPEGGGNVGKFVTVIGLQPDGQWEFLLDGYSSAPYKAFIAADSMAAHKPEN